MTILMCEYGGLMEDPAFHEETNILYVWEK